MGGRSPACGPMGRRSAVCGLVARRSGVCGPSGRRSAAWLDGRSGRALGAGAWPPGSRTSSFIGPSRSPRRSTPGRHGDVRRGGVGRRARASSPPPRTPGPSASPPRASSPAGHAPRARSRASGRPRSPHRHPEARPPAGRASRRLAAALSARGLDALALRPGGGRRPPARPGRSRGRRRACGGGRGRRPGGARPRRPARGGLRRPDRRAGPRPRRHAPRHGRRDRGRSPSPGCPAAGPPHETCALALGAVGRALAAGGLATPAALPARARRAAEGAADDAATR